MKRRAISVVSIALAVGLFAGPLPGTLIAAASTILARAASVCIIAAGAALWVQAVNEVKR